MSLGGRDWMCVGRALWIPVIVEKRRKGVEGRELCISEKGTYRCRKDLMLLSGTCISFGVWVRGKDQ